MPSCLSLYSFSLSLSPKFSSPSASVRMVMFLCLPEKEKLSPPQWLLVQLNWYKCSLFTVHSVHSVHLVHSQLQLHLHLHSHVESVAMPSPFHSRPRPRFHFSLSVVACW